MAGWPESRIRLVAVLVERRPNRMVTACRAFPDCTAKLVRGYRDYPAMRGAIAEKPAFDSELRNYAVVGCTLLPARTNEVEGWKRLRYLI